MADVDSSTGGYLSPEGTPAPEHDDELDALFQTAIRNITALPGSLVRPRWQPNPPKQPEADVNWCALAVTAIEADAGPAIKHISAGEGSAQYERHEELQLFVTFYGPRAGAFAALLRDGISMPQNMEALRANEIGFVDCGRARRVPEFVNQTWIDRVDMLVRFRRKVTRRYGVRNLLAADINLIDDTHVDELITVPPAP